VGEELNFYAPAKKQLRKTTISFVISYRLSVRMKQFGPQQTDFRETDKKKAIPKLCAAVYFNIQGYSK
jgi:hypothetical protein